MHQHNDAFIDCTFLQLRNVIRSLGQGGGSMTPSIYETAQVLRFCPELVEVDRVVAWLLRCQHTDGGWGEVEAPLYRIVPTMAALLALRRTQSSVYVKQACLAGQKFLEEQDISIEPIDGEQLPVAIELILPCLLDELDDTGIRLSRSHFKHVEELGALRRRLIALQPQKSNSPQAFSWEAWGTHPDEDLVGCVGGVGHSPAATAWWLRLEKDRMSTSSARIRAQTYLNDASKAAKSGIRGVVPAPWPMNRFEQSFVLHVIEIAGLLDCSKLQCELYPQLDDLRRALDAGAVGFSDHFMPDGDDTSAVLAVLAAAGFDVDCTVLSPFERAEHFVAYPFEMHASYAVTARAVQALSLVGRDVTQWRTSIAEAQQPDGWWPSEKWNRSRLYGTSLALAALDKGRGNNGAAAAQALFDFQHEDGGWGCFGPSTPIETAFAILALHNITKKAQMQAESVTAMGFAHSYLKSAFMQRRTGMQRMWIGKDLYSAKRVDLATLLCALIASNRYGQFDSRDLSLMSTVI